ncbi:MAG: nuclear transport factor 2 family protein [Acidobacteria bacterium]|nr:nuclear transport factor 2 family protein [Acidobacteriota bacterium]
MRRMPAIVSAFSLLVASYSCVGHSSVSAQGSAEQQVIQVEKDWCTAVVRKDAAALGRILSDDLTSVDIFGNFENKATVIANEIAPSTITAVCNPTDLKVRVYGNAAVATSITITTGQGKGVEYKDRKSFWTDTFIKREGRWQCVASQGTLISPPRKAALVQSLENSATNSIGTQQP